MNPFLYAFIIFILATTASFIVADFSKAAKVVGVVGIIGLLVFIIWSFAELGVGYGLGGILWAVFMFNAATKSQHK